MVANPRSHVKTSYAALLGQTPEFQQKNAIDLRKNFGEFPFRHVFLVYSLLTASPFLRRDPTCNHCRIEYTYQQHDLREVTASLTSIVAAVIKRHCTTVWPVSGGMIWRSFMLGIRIQRYAPGPHRDPHAEMRGKGQRGADGISVRSSLLRLVYITCAMKLPMVCAASSCFCGWYDRSPSAPCRAFAGREQPAS